MHRSSYDKMMAFKDEFLTSLKEQNLFILDLGSQDINGTYKEIFNEEKWNYRGMDMAQGKNVDIILDNPYVWSKIKSDSVDVVISGQAFEHIEFFWVTMLEVARVMKPGGLCCIIAPSGGHEHRFPVDCWRFYKDGFKALARFVLLEEIRAYKQEEPDPQYSDSSNLWLDTVLICKKGKYSRSLMLRHKIWRFLAHRICLKSV